MRNLTYHTEEVNEKESEKGIEEEIVKEMQEEEEILMVWSVHPCCNTSCLLARVMTDIFLAWYLGEVWKGGKHNHPGERVQKMMIRSRLFLRVEPIDSEEQCTVQKGGNLEWRVSR